MKVTEPQYLSIGGQRLPSSSGKFFTVEDPTTGQPIASVADATDADALHAARCADAVSPLWSDTAPRARADILRRAYEAVLDAKAPLAQLISSETGKPSTESLREVDYGAEFLRWYSEEAVRINGRIADAPSGTGKILVSSMPVGTVLAITPWNFPLAMGTRKIGPALAAGCPIIVKPAEETPLTMLALADLFIEAGLPAGALSVVPTTQAHALTEALMVDGRVHKLTFTGSTAVGRRLSARASGLLLRTSMELGGNAPLIVFDDADLECAVEGAIAAKFRNGGQACTAANRILVQSSIHRDFVRAFCAAVTRLEIGVDIGPLISTRQRERVDSLVADAIGAGAELLVGGLVSSGPGYHYAPTVLDQVPPQARIVGEEIFGPVAAITTFDDEDNAIARANATCSGLAAYLFTTSLARAQRVSRALRVGMVGVNRGVISDAAAPFGGIRDSGHGCEGGPEGIREYLTTKYLAV